MQIRLHEMNLRMDKHQSINQSINQSIMKEEMVNRLKYGCITTRTPKTVCSFGVDAIIEYHSLNIMQLSTSRSQHGVLNLLPPIQTKDSPSNGEKMLNLNTLQVPSGIGGMCILYTTHYVHLSFKQCIPIGVNPNSCDTKTHLQQSMMCHSLITPTLMRT